MNRVFCSGAAGWSSALRLAASATLIASAVVICAQAPATDSQSPAAVPADSSSTISSPGSNPSPSAPLAANVKGGSGDGTGFGLPLTQFPAPAAGYFQSYRGFQGGGTDFMGAGRPAGEYNRFGGAGPAGIAGTAGFGFQGGSFGPSASLNFNQMMRANIALPFTSSVGTFKLT